MTTPTDAPADSPVPDDVAEQSRSPLGPRAPFLRAIPMPIRLLLGYLIAVGAGAVIFTLVYQMVFEGSLDQLAKGTMLFFVLGLIFGLPYAIIGSLAFWHLMPRTAWNFMLTGTLCPVATIFLFSILTPGDALTAPQFLGISLVSLPSGPVAAYLYGAIGFGFGFGRWRIDDR